ncbi:MAG TPA: nuclear transport factor 2 family protein [Burkholderiales bacterium]|nr:nuclear transport factor 2 family protein [Burkholderiales bacterium]
MSDASRSFAELLERMTSAICAGDALVAAECFTPDGVYHDGFYGEFAGREAIAGMVTGLFHRDAKDFKWHVSDACSDGRIGYARYRFAYVSKIAGSEGRRVGFDGISCCMLEGGRIRRYSELFERAPVLLQLGFGDQRILKSIKRWLK